MVKKNLAVKLTGVLLIQLFIPLVIMPLMIALIGFGNLLPVQAQPIRSQPDTGSSETTARIGELRSQAFAAVRSGDYVSAEQTWSQLLEVLPNEAAIWSNRGNSRVALNQFEAAIADFDRAIQLAPAEPDPYLNRGATWEALGNWDAAIADYNRVIDLNPKDAAAYNNRGNAEAGLGDWQTAIADYQMAIKLRSNYIYAQANEAIALYQVGETDTAIKILKNLARKHPNFADARAALTAALWATGQQGEAESNWVAVMGLDKRYKDVQWVANTRRWSPAMVSALEKFLKLQ